jgi:hypothetical protein
MDASACRSSREHLYRHDWGLGALAPLAWVAERDLLEADAVAMGRARDVQVSIDGDFGSEPSGEPRFWTILNSIYARARRRPCVTMFGIFEARTLSTQPVRRRCGMCGVYRMEPRCREPGTSTCELLSEGTRATADRTWDKDRACYAGIGTARRRISTRSSIKILSRSSQ